MSQTLNISQAIKLYQLMAQRCEKSGVAPHQAQIYHEMVDFISDCTTVEESMQKIKNSQYYLAPSIALVQDTIEAHKTAATHNNMPELTEVYNNKLAKIAEDTGEIYIASYEQIAQNIKTQYLNTMQAFTEIFRAYSSYIFSGNSTHLTSITTNLRYLEKPSNDFAELSQIERFRSLIPVDDTAYNQFVNDVIHYQNGQQIFELLGNANTLENKISDEWDQVKALKSEILETGTSVKTLTHQAKATAIAPKMDTQTDVSQLTYTFADEEVR